MRPFASTRIGGRCGGARLLGATQIFRAAIRSRLLAGREDERASLLLLSPPGGSDARMARGTPRPGVVVVRQQGPATLCALCFFLTALGMGDG